MTTPENPEATATRSSSSASSSDRSAVAATVGTRPLNDANRLGLDYTAEAACFTATTDRLGGMLDVHSHIDSPACARAWLKVADTYGVQKTFTMTGLRHVQRMREELEREELDRIEFICVPDFSLREEEGVFTSRWLEDIAAFRELGCRVMKFWCGPRGLDMDASPESPFRLDSPIRQQGMQLAYDLGYRVFMVHVSDPDTWFQTMYADASKYGTKAAQYPAFKEAMDRYPDVTWIAAHTAGSPEDLDFVQQLLDAHPNLVIDISACKWQVRELSKDTARFVQLVQANPGRVLYGTDVVAWDSNNRAETDPETGAPSGIELYASRYWAYKTLLETEYNGLCPIVDPDFKMLDDAADEKQTCQLVGANFDDEALSWLYRKAAERVFEAVGGAWATPTTPGD